MDKELDLFYTRQIIYWLRKGAQADEEIAYWERKRMELRKQ